MSIISQVHAFLYGTHIEPEEEARLEALGVASIESWPHTARRMIMHRERLVYPTSFSVRFGPEDVQFHKIEGFEIALDVADQAVSIPVVRDGEFEPDLTSCFRRNLKPGMSVIDIGANIGFFTLLAASIVGPSGAVTAFEPHSENCRLLLLSVDRNEFQHVRLLPTALGSRNGSAFFSTMLGTNGALQPSTAEELMRPTCTVVPVMRLDDLPHFPVDLIKMDVEGAEGMVIDGAEATIRRNKPVICSEFSPEMLARVSGVNPAEHVRRICDMGYRVVRLAREISNEAEIAIPDVGAFIEGYGEITRISELVFYPE